MLSNVLMLEGWTVQAVEQADTSVKITASYGPEPEACPRCGVVGARFYKHGALSATYVDAPHFGKPCVITVKQ